MLRRFLIVLISISAISATTVPKKLIKWNFGNYSKLTYEYSQSMSSDVEFFKNTDKREMTAKLIVNIKDKEHADMILIDIKSLLMSQDSTGNYVAKDTIEMPNQILFQDLTPEGNIDGNIPQSSLMLAKTLFPITGKKMKLGQTIDLNMSMPFSIYGSNINVKGNNSVKYESSKNGIEELTITDVSEYTIPEEIEQDYLCYLKGKSNFHFDAKKGLFKDGVIHMNMAMGINVIDSTTMEKSAQMIMDMNTEIKLKLIKTE